MMKKAAKIHINSGFTLIELLTVIFIIAIIMAIILVSLSKARMKSRDNKRKTDLITIQQALEMYYTDQSASRTFPCATTPPAPAGCRTDIANLAGFIPTTNSDFQTALSGYLGGIPADPIGDYNYLYKSGTNSVLTSGKHYILLTTLENCPTNPAQGDADCNKSWLSTWWGSNSAPLANRNQIIALYGIGKNYHYFISSD